MTRTLAGRRIKNLFLLLGWVGMLASFVAAAYSWFGVRPRLNKVTDQIQGDLSDINSLTLSLTHGDQPAVKLVHLLPETVTTLHGTLVSAADSLYGGAKTTNDAKKGITGLVMPKDALGLDTQKFARTGQQLNLLAGMVGQMQAPINALVNQSDNAVSPLDHFSTRLTDLQSALKSAALPVHAALLGFAFAAVYLFFGGFCFVSAYAVDALILSTAESQTENPGWKTDRLAS